MKGDTHRIGAGAFQADCKHCQEMAARMGIPIEVLVKTNNMSRGELTKFAESYKRGRNTQ